MVLIAYFAMKKKCFQLLRFEKEKRIFCSHPLFDFPSFPDSNPFSFFTPTFPER
jgi:hypothetical protein